MYSTKNIKDFLDLSGERRNPLVLESALISFGYNELKVSILISYLDLLKNSNVFNDLVKDFYINKLSYKDIEKKYNKNKPQIANIIKRYTNKLFKLTGVDIYLSVKEETDNRKLNYYSNLVKDLRITYAVAKDTELIDNLIIDLNEYFPPIIEERPNITEEEVIQITKRFELLSKPYINLIIQALDSEHLGYFKYLLETPDNILDKQDLYYKNIIKSRMFLN